ncbi:uncharacterized protein LOC134276891 [Saccostrea cucullata]|uniref:uncharacterized protein LOC134276891 n=1 Tax=Saccostrea cuccullata TaxID=36930 RepID=UPI002ED0C373
MVDVMQKSVLVPYEKYNRLMTLQETHRANSEADAERDVAENVPENTIALPHPEKSQNLDMSTQTESEDSIKPETTSANLSTKESEESLITEKPVRRYMRKSCKEKGRKLQKPEGVSKTQTDVNNPSYFVKEKTTYKLSDSNPYNETKEGDYNHLRDKDSRRKNVEDTYQHTKPFSNGNISNYDSTAYHQNQGPRFTGQMTPQDEEQVSSTYSEINNSNQSTYFVLEKPSSYEFVDDSMLDSESPYNETEEGDYDHLRNKDSRKKDTDDTYHHATFEGNRDMSDYSISIADPQQELESTYDHMHEPLNLQSNSDYGYNYIDPNIKHYK